MPDENGASAAFELLHPEVQRWIWQQGWSELREIQERSIRALAGGMRDIVLAAATASGKTEAAFLPVLSELAHAPVEGFGAIYVSPLKALINDQFRRLDMLCDVLGIPVHKWHGDVSQGLKAKARKNPQGIVLITPESLEALLVRRGGATRSMFGNVKAVVIDELHSFIGSERGMQLLSILARIEDRCDRDIPRIGLSATLGDMRLAAEFMRPGHGESVEIVNAGGGGSDLRLQLRGYLSGLDPVHKPKPQPVSEDMADDDVPPEDPEEAPGSSKSMIAAHLFETMRGGHNLIFAGSRQNVELYADRLARRCEKLGIPHEFWAHHGSLSKELREEAESRMRGEAPANVVCTSTLELGVDIGPVEAVGQVGEPHSASGLRQRMGRSGRREGFASILRCYVEAPRIEPKTHLLDRLRVPLVQSIAIIDLLLEKWCETPDDKALHLSTLLHQTLALIGERGGIKPNEAWSLLCRRGPFRGIGQLLYATLLRQMGSSEIGLIEQAPDGLLMLGPQGERLVEGQGFWAVFKTPDEFRVISSGRTIGMLPTEEPILSGQFIVLGGRRWKVESVLLEERVVLVQPASGGKPPRFGGERGDLDDFIIERMRRIWEGAEMPRYLDATARTMLEEGRGAYRSFGIDHDQIVRLDERFVLFPWVGSKKLRTLVFALRRLNVEALDCRVAVEVKNGDLSAVVAALHTIAYQETLEPVELAQGVLTKAREKYDGLLGDELLTLDFAARSIDVDSLPEVARRLLG